MQQNRTILAVDSDNFTDISVRYTKSAENAFLIAELNGMSIDDIIASGTAILIPTESDLPVIVKSSKATEFEISPAALLELLKKHSSTVASTQQLGHVRSGSQIRVNPDGTMEVLVGVPGAKGDAGTDGIDGREIELRKTADYVQWRYLGETSWINLIALVDLKGAKGDQGLPGVKGDTGLKGDKPAHNWSGTSLRFENPNGSYGSYVNLRGPQGAPGIPGLDLPEATFSEINLGETPERYVSPRALADSNYFKNDEAVTITRKTVGDRLLFREDISHEVTVDTPVVYIVPDYNQCQNVYIPLLDYQFNSLEINIQEPIGVGYFQIILRSLVDMIIYVKCSSASHIFWKDDVHVVIAEHTARMYSVYFDGQNLFIEDKYFGNLP